uniref:GST C-terminal domain-containing protein n=1 Tax=Glycine max TaxID=3847 RepID=K7LZD2_SOYBN
MRTLKGLEDAVPVSVASPGLDGSWKFKRAGGPDTGTIAPCLDKANACRTLKQIYRLRRGGYDGRSTVPMLWDKASKDVVCNESYDIIHLFNSELNSVAQNPGLDLSPPQLKKRIGEWNQIIYPNSKRQQRGLYSQEGYDKELNDLFSTLDKLEVHLANSGYLCGDTLTLVDICLFTTLVRFDLAYNVLLNCTKKKLCEYTNLHAYLRDIYQIPKVAATCNFTDIMDGYYKILFPLNPGSIRPVMPSTCEHESLCRPHARESLSSATLAFVK